MEKVNIPLKYYELLQTIREIEYKYGDNVADMPKTTAKRYEKAKKEMAKIEFPTDDDYVRFFDTRTPELYDLWLGRESDEPVSKRELYAIVKDILSRVERVDSSITSHIYSC